MTIKNNKPSNKILNSDKANNAPEPETNRPTATISKSRRMTSFREFCFVNELRPEIVAGFKYWLHGDDVHFDDEWKELFEKYKNR